MHGQSITTGSSNFALNSGVLISGFSGLSSSTYFDAYVPVATSSGDPLYVTIVFYSAATGSGGRRSVLRAYPLYISTNFYTPATPFVTTSLSISSSIASPGTCLSCTTG